MFRDKRQKKHSPFFKASILSHFLIITCLSVCQAEEPLSLDLEQCLKIALENNQQILTARENIKNARAIIDENSASAYPELKASADYTRLGNIDEVNFGEQNFSFVPEDNYKLDLNLSQKLYSPKVFEAIKASKTYAKSVDMELEIVRQSIVSLVKESFYKFLLSKELLNIHKESVAQLKRQLDDVKKRFEAGFATDFDVLRAEVQLANAIPDLAKVKYGIEVAKASLSLILGLKHSTQINVVGELIPSHLEITMEEALATALKKRPEFVHMDYTIETLERYAKVAKKEFSPTLRMHGNLSYANDDVEIGQEAEWDYSWSVGVTLDYKIFDGWERRSKVTQALIGVTNAKLDRAQLLNSISLEVKTAYSALTESQELILSQAKNIERAERAYDIARVGNSNGIITELQLLDAQLALTSARVNYSQAVHGFLIARARIEKAMGIAEADFSPEPAG
ncbi:MAG: TolC family protein [Proteobacteria bacterium]|nr:TolC family protein [Pseudomonadota bacterium]